MTAEHLRTGREYDASLIWTEDPNKDSFKVCLREMQNFDGKHEDITVVCFKNHIVIKSRIKYWCQGRDCNRGNKWEGFSALSV